MNGFDKGTGKMTEETWSRTTEIVKRELGLKEGDSLLEVDCGARAMLLPLSEIDIKVIGVDHFSSLVKIAKRVIPDLIAYVRGVCKLPFSHSEFDAILAHSVFHSFLDYKYTKRMLLEMSQVSKGDGKILIMDVLLLLCQNVSFLLRENDIFSKRRGNIFSGI